MGGIKSWYICFDCEKAVLLEEGEDWLMAHWGHDVIILERSEGQIYTHILQKEEV